MTGNSGTGYPPSRMWRSVRQMPVAATRTAISSGAGSPRSNRSIVNAAPRLATTAAVLFNAFEIPGPL